MNFALILEALKFYKLKHTRAVQLWFLLLYAVNLLFYILPAGDMDFSKVIDYLNTLSSGTVPDITAIPLTAGNWVTIGMFALTTLLNGFFTLLYATLFVGEQDTMSAGQSVVRCLASLPRFILLAVLLLVPAILSACFFFIPLLIFGLMMYFLPLELTIGRRKLQDAAQHSLTTTQGFKLFIFIQVILISLVITLPQSLVSFIVPKASLPLGIVASFFIVARSLIQGRLMGILYQVIVKKTPPVVPSKPKESA